MKKFNDKFYGIKIYVINSNNINQTKYKYKLNKMRLKNMAEKGNTKANKVLKMLDDYDSMLSSILIGNKKPPILKEIDLIEFNIFFGQLKE